MNNQLMQNLVQLMKRKSLLVATLIAATFGCVTANAHHSFAATFNENETNTIEGVLTNFSFRNPHVVFNLDVTNEDGSVTNWMIEGSAATGWQRAGWGSDSIQVGEMFRVSGSATKDGSPMIALRGEWALLDSETKEVIATLSANQDPNEARNAAVALAQSSGADRPVQAGGEDRPARGEGGGDRPARGEGGDRPTETAEPTFIPAKLPSGEPNFTGVTAQFGRIPGGPDGNDPDMPYNELGASVAAEWSVENDPQVFCDPPGLLRQAAYTSYGLNINQYSDHVTIEYEEFGTKRAIFFSDELPRPGVPSHMGDSIARYEGDSLIIETVNLLANASGHRGKPLSDQLRTLEVYTREDLPEVGTVLTVETTAYDPLYLNEPWTISRTSVYRDGYEFIGNACVPPLRERPANVWQQFDWPE